MRPEPTITRAARGALLALLVACDSQPESARSTLEAAGAAAAAVAAETLAPARGAGPSDDAEVSSAGGRQAASELPGQGAEPPRQVPFTVRDSAGVRIVESAAPAWSAAERWTVAPAPSVQIGAADGEAPYLFTRLFNGALRSDGAVALLDEGTMQIRVFDAGGQHLATLGGMGGGPGEFTGPARPYSQPIAFVGGDTLVAWDSGQSRLTWFDLGGTVLRSVGLAAEHPEVGHLRRVADIWRVAPDGSVLWVRDLRDRAPDRIYNYDVSIVRAADLALLPVVELEGTRRVVVRYPSSTTGNPINLNVAATLFAGAGFPAVAADPVRVIVADPDRWELRLHGPDGALREILRSAVPRVPVTAEDVTEQRQVWENRGPEALQGFYTLSVPDSFPAIAAWDVHWDDEGYLWVPHYRSPDPDLRVFEVFAGDGRWLGRVSAPTDELSRILAISHGRILAVHRDELGIESARVYHVRRGPP